MIICNDISDDFRIDFDSFFYSTNGLLRGACVFVGPHKHTIMGQCASSLALSFFLSLSFPLVLSHSDALFVSLLSAS